MGHGQNRKGRSPWFSSAHHPEGYSATTNIFTIDDYRAYLDLMVEWSGWYKVEIWA